MAETVEEITVNFFDEEKKQLVKELDKKILTKGAWTTVMFKYQDLDKATDTFKESKYSIRRYQKTNGEYRSKSKFNISSAKQATQIIEILSEWIKE